MRDTMTRNLYIISPNLYLIAQQESGRSQRYYWKIKDSNHGQCNNGSQES